MSVYDNVPRYPFSGFRGVLFNSVLQNPGRFIDVPAAVGRGFNATTAAKKINLRFERDGFPFEIRTQGAAKSPTHVGLFVVDAIGEGRVSRDSRSGRNRTAVNEGAEQFGKEKITDTLVRYAEKRDVVQEARQAAIEEAKERLAAELAEAEALTGLTAGEATEEASTEEVTEVPTEEPAEATEEAPPEVPTEEVEAAEEPTPEAPEPTEEAETEAEASAEAPRGRQRRRR